MAEVPTAYVKDKPVDYESEIFAMLGEGVRVGDYHFAPPSLGVWALWEIIDSPIVHGSEEAIVGDFLRLMWINHARRDAVPLVREWVSVGKPKAGEWCLMDVEVLSWAGTLPPELYESGEISDECKYEILAQLPLCYTGYETIPGKDASAAMWLFAGEAFGAICAKDAVEYDGLIWDVPMTLHGHITAFNAKMNGTKGVGRPKDEEDIKEQLRLANEREENGEIHPWQEIDPLSFGLSARQCEHSNLVARFEDMVRRAKEDLKKNPNTTKYRPKD
jgi:hypothetical protein